MPLPQPKMMTTYKELREYCKDMSMSELVSWLQNTPGHYSNLSSLWGYIHTEIDRIDNFKGSDGGRLIWECLYNYLNIDFKNKTVIDFGPGNAESIIVAKERGASKCYFVDNDPIIFRFVELLGFDGYYSDYRIDKAPIKKVDYLFAKGSINSDEWTFNKMDINGFLSWVETLATTLVITPTYEKGETIEGWNFTCVGERRKKYLNGTFHNTFIKRGYKLIYVEGHNHEYRFPFTYVLDRG